MKPSRDKVKEYEERLQQHFISSTRVMTDGELRKITQKINKAVGYFQEGMTTAEIRIKMRNT